MVGDPLLLAVRRIIGAIEVEDDALRDAIPFPLLQVELHQGESQAVAGFGVHGVLQAGQRGLAGQIRLVREPATDQLQEGIMTQGGGIVLILVAAGDLEDALADQRLEGVVDRAAAPLRDVLSEGGAEAKRRIGLREPAETAVGGELGTVEGRGETGGGQGEGDRLGHEASPGEAWFGHFSLPRVGDCLVFFHPVMNKKGMDPSLRASHPENDAETL